MTSHQELETYYAEWLEIPSERLPPNHYALLGVEDFESDAEKIESAAKTRAAYLHQIASGPNRKVVQALLGQVAIARRCLADSEAKAGYDEELRNPAPTSTAAEKPRSVASSQVVGKPTSAAGETVASQSSSSATQQAKPKSNAGGTTTASDLPRRKKPSQWKYHAISAGGLLLLVAIVFFINRRGGGRRAAEADDSSIRSSTAVRETKAKQDSSKKLTGGQTRQARKQTKPSGLGLGGEGKFADVLSEIDLASDQVPTPSTGTVKGGFQPLGGRPTTKLKNLVAADWPQQLEPLASFPSELESEFECEKGWGWMKVNEKRIIIQPIARNGGRWIDDPDSDFRPTSAASLRTSIASGPRETRVGFAVSRVRIGLRPQKGSVQVYLRDRGKNVDEEVLHSIKTTAPVRLAVFRKPDQPTKLCWMVKDTKEGGKYHGGEVTIDDFPEKPAFNWYVNAPKKKPAKAFWIDQLQRRD